jgi:hypothetical protein
MMNLHPCPECQRHVKSDERTCPFCATELSSGELSSPETSAPARATQDSRIKGRRLGRAALFAMGGLAVACGGRAEDTESDSDLDRGDGDGEWDGDGDSDGFSAGGGATGGWVGSGGVYGAPPAGTGGDNTGGWWTGNSGGVYGAPPAGGQGGEASEDPEGSGGSGIVPVYGGPGIEDD